MPGQSSTLSVDIQPFLFNVSVDWESSNEKVADVVGAGTFAYVTAGEKTGTAKVTAYVTDDNTDRTYKVSCTVTVSANGNERPKNNDEATYDPAMKISMNAAYTGTEV